MLVDTPLQCWPVGAQVLTRRVRDWLSTEEGVVAPRGRSLEAQHAPVYLYDMSQIHPNWLTLIPPRGPIGSQGSHVPSHPCHPHTYPQRISHVPGHLHTNPQYRSHVPAHPHTYPQRNSHVSAPPHATYFHTTCCMYPHTRIHTHNAPRMCLHSTHTHTHNEARMYPHTCTQTNNAAHMCGLRTRTHTHKKMKWAATGAKIECGKGGLDPPRAVMGSWDRGLDPPRAQVGC